MFLPAVTGYIGGGVTKLDGLPTAGMALNVVEFIHSTDGLRTFQLVAGTDAESSPAVIRPDDYDAGTNARVWKLQDRALLDAPSDGTTYGRNNGAWIAVSAASINLGTIAAWVAQTGNDGTGVCGDPAHPYATAQAAVTAGARALVLIPRDDAGTYGPVTTGTPLSFIGFDASRCIVGPITATAGISLTGNGAGLVTVSEISADGVAGAPGTSGTAGGDVHARGFALGSMHSIGGSATSGPSGGANGANGGILVCEVPATSPTIPPALEETEPTGTTTGFPPPAAATGATEGLSRLAGASSTATLL